MQTIVGYNYTPGVKSVQVEFIFHCFSADRIVTDDVCLHFISCRHNIYSDDVLKVL